MLKIRCSCGKRLAIDATHVGRKMACPACQKSFCLTAEKVRALAAKSRGASAPQSATASVAAKPKHSADKGSGGSTYTEVAPAELDLQPASLDIPTTEPSDSLELLTELATDANQARTERAAAPSVVLVEEAVDLEYARGSGPGIRTNLRKTTDVTQDPRHGYWEDVALAFVYPVRNAMNAITFGMIATAVVIRFFLSYAAMMGIGFFASLVIYGWFCSLYLSVVQDTAAGSDDLPGIKMEQGWWEDIIKPAFMFFGSQAIVFLPAFLSITFLKSTWVALGLVAVGIFLWPLIILLFSMGDVSKIARVDLMTVTILRTFLAYLSVWLMLLIVCVVMFFSTIAIILVRQGLLNVTMPQFLTKPAVSTELLIQTFQTYLALVAMRFIGLYYLHFKQRFAFVLE